MSTSCIFPEKGFIVNDLRISACFLHFSKGSKELIMSYCSLSWITCFEHIIQVSEIDFHTVVKMNKNQLKIEIRFQMYWGYLKHGWK